MKRIVVGYDASELGADALHLAQTLSAPEGGELIVAAIDEVEPIFGDVTQWRELRNDYFEQVFEAAAKQLGDSSFTRRTAAGSVPWSLERLAEEEQADLIVVGSSHRGKLGQTLAGSVGERLLHGSPCAVAIAPRGFGSRQQPPVQRIGLAYDGQEEASAALQEAVKLARAFGAALRLITVSPTREELIPGRIGHSYPGYANVLHGHFEKQLEQGRAAVPRGIELETVLLDGDPARELAAQGAELDLLVLGSRGYGPLRRVLLGGVAAEVVGMAPCPLIVLPRTAEVNLPSG